MKTKKLAFLMVITSVFFLHEANAKEHKKYLSQENIHFGDEGIFVALDDSVFLTKALFSDHNGLYVKPSTLLIARGESKWWCPGCRKWDHKNKKPDANCTDCSWPNKKRKKK